MTSEEDRLWQDVLEARGNRDMWKAQALLYAKELALVNRACSRKVKAIEKLRHEVLCLENDLKYMMDLYNVDMIFPVETKRKRQP